MATAGVGVRYNPAMRPDVARFLAHHATSPRHAVLEDVARYRGVSLEERGRDVERVCKAAAAVLAARPDRDAVMALRDPPHPSYEEIVRRLRVPWRSRP